MLEEMEFSRAEKINPSYSSKGILFKVSLRGTLVKVIEMMQDLSGASAEVFDQGFLLL